MNKALNLTSVTVKSETEPPSTRCAKLLIITKRLISLTLGALVILGVIFGLTLFLGQKFMVSWACFACGLIGGFVSIQQRIKNIGEEELDLLSRSWGQILLIPVYGGIFALVIYIAFLSKIVEGPLFPSFSLPSFSAPPSTTDMKNFFANTYPATAIDFAKLVFWCFVAGFSERLVPQIISSAENRSAKGPAKDEHCK